MLSQLDLSTVLLFYNTSLLAGALAIFHVRRSAHRPQGLTEMGLAYLMLAAGAALAWKGGAAALPAPWWTHASLLLGVGGYAAFYAGIRGLSGRASLPGWTLAAPALACSGVGLLTGFPLDNLPRAGVFHATAVVALAAAAGLMLRNHRQEALPSSRVLAALLALSASIYAARLIFIVRGTASSNGFAQAFFVQMFCHFGIALMVSTICKERAEVRLAQLAQTDPLTGVGNRRWLQTRMPESLPSLSAILQLDLDRFKLINDQMGHAAGDAALVAFATCIQQQLRSCDVVARTGGEEFVVYAAQVTEQDARALGERLRASVQALRIKHGQASIELTTSIGIAWVREGPVQSQVGLNRADQMLYAAKRGGRNRAELCVLEGPSSGAAMLGAEVDI